jgi:RHS repeat-associated protein
MKRTKLLLLILSGFSFIFSLSAANLVVGDYGGMFSVSPSGGAIYSIPIELPQGVNGMSPKVFLNYNSQSGIGDAGYGWNIVGASEIAKEGARPYYDNMVLPVNNDNNADYLSLDGQRLIFYEEIDEDVVEFRTENDNYDRIVRLGKNGNFYFEVYTTNGRKKTYKQLKEGAAYYEGNFGWHVTQEEDLYGNYISYNYSVTSSGYNISTVLLSSISYGGNLKENKPHTCKVEFFYGASLTYPFQYALGGYTKSIHKLLSEVRTYANSTLNSKFLLSYSDDFQGRKYLERVKKYGNNGDYLDDLIFSWNKNAFSLTENSFHDSYFSKYASQSSDVSYYGKQWFIGDYNNDGKSDLLTNSCVVNSGKIGLYFQYFKNNAGTSSDLSGFSYEKSSTLNSEAKYSSYSGTLSCYFTNRVNQDIILPCLENKTILKFINLKNITDYYAITLSTEHDDIPLYSCADFNMDGYADIVIIERNLCRGRHRAHIIYGGSSSNFSGMNPVKSTVLFPAEGTIQRIAIFDMNGDGLQDIVAVSDKGYFTLKNKGQTTGYATCNFSNGSSDFKNGMKFNQSEDLAFEFGDFNGDGIGDFFKATSTSNTLYLGRSNCIFEPIGVSQIATFSSNTFAFSADVNGDGKSELVVVRDGGKNVYWYQYSGSAFSLSFSNYAAYRTLSRDKIIVGDLYGTGRTEVFSVGASLISSQINSARIYRTTANFSNEDGLINKILSPMKDISISYGLLTDKEICSKNTTLSNGLNLMHLNTPLKVVRTVTDYGENAFFENSIKTYTYEDAIANVTGKGFLGFKKVKIEDEVSETSEITEFELSSSPAVLFPKKESKYAGSEIYASTDYTYSKIITDENSGKAFYLALTKKVENDALNGVSHTSSYSNYHLGYPLNETKNYGSGVIVTTSYPGVTSGGEYNMFLPLFKNVTKKNSSGSVTASSQFVYNAQYSPSKIIELKGTDKAITREFTYGVNGNLLKEKVSAQGCESRIKSYSYTASGRFLSSVAQEDGSVVSYTHNEALGRPTKMVETMGTLSFTTNYSLYDGFNNCLKKTFSDGRTETVASSYFSHIRPSHYIISKTLTGSSDSEVMYDASGRVMREKQYDLDGKERIIFYSYDYAGRLEYEYVRNTGSTPSGNPSTQYSYDKFGRLIQVSAPSGVTKYSYDKLKRTITSPLGTVVEKCNSAGQLIERTENGQMVTFTYAPNGLPSSSSALSSSGSHTTTFSYDIAGNRTSINDPDVGIVSVEYDAYGRKVLTTTENGSEIYYLYDSKGRLYEQSDGTDKTTFTYNESGQLTKECRGNYSCAYTYDAFNRLTKKSESLDGNSFITKFAYSNNYGEVASTTYPSGIVVKNSYDSYGHLTAVSCAGKTIWKPNKLDSQGRVVEETLAGDVIQTYSYDSKSRLTSEKAYKGSSKLKDLSYSYTTLGLVKKADAISGNTESYTYDSSNRLATVTAAKGSSSLSGTHRYDAKGNMTKTWDGYWNTIGYGANGMPPHQVSSVGYSSSSVSNAQTVSFDSYRMATQIKQGNLTYSIDYKPDRRRYRSRLYKSGTLQRTKYYLGDYEKELSKDGKSREIHYLCGGNGLAAIYVRTAGKDTLFAAVTDRQNSLTAVMDVATNKIEKFSYKPWGMRRNASNWTTNVTMDVAGRFSRGYCMHEHLPELGLIDMGGRMYNARTNQFLSPDPYVQSPGSWLSHNRFAYCMQNPVWRTDPSGEFSNYYLGLMFDYAEMMANIYLGIQQMLESVAISIQTTVASAQSAAAGAASSTAYGYTSSYEPADYSYNPTVVNNVYASISQNTQNAVASAKNAVASVQNALSYADDCVDRIGYSVGSFLFRSDAYSIYFSGSAYLGVGVTFSAELGHMEQYGGFIAASASFGTGFDLSGGGGLKISNYWGEQQMTAESYGGEGNGWSIGVGPLDFGYSFSQDKTWSSFNIGYSKGLPFGVSFSNTNTRIIP